MACREQEERRTGEDSHRLSTDLLQHHGETGQPTVPGIALLNMAKFYHLSSSAHWSCNMYCQYNFKTLLVFTTNVSIIRMYTVSVILTV